MHDDLSDTDELFDIEDATDVDWIEQVQDDLFTPASVGSADPSSPPVVPSSRLPAVTPRGAIPSAPLPVPSRRPKTRPLSDRSLPPSPPLPRESLVDFDRIASEPAPQRSAPPPLGPQRSAPPRRPAPSRDIPTDRIPVQRTPEPRASAPSVSLNAPPPPAPVAEPSSNRDRILLISGALVAALILGAGIFMRFGRGGSDAEELAQAMPSEVQPIEVEAPPAGNDENVRGEEDNVEAQELEIGAVEVAARDRRPRRSSGTTRMNASPRPRPTTAPPEPAETESPSPSAPAPAPRAQPTREAAREPVPPVSQEPAPNETQRAGVSPAPATPAPAPREPDPADSNEAPSQATPSRDDVSTALVAVRPAVSACIEGHGNVRVRVTFSGSGRVASAEVLDPLWSRVPYGGCISRAVRRARVPRFQQARFVVVYPFQF